MSDVCYADLPEALDGEFFPALLPRARVIVLFSPHPDPARRFVKVRVGLAAPPGFSLHNLLIPQFDAGYGGRWNAGSNKRGATGTPLTPKEYVTHIVKRLNTPAAP